jgi:hypothetical protein
MPTTKPRLTITLEPRTHQVLARLSRAGGDSMSSLITQFVDLAVPSMERLVVILEHAQRAPEEIKDGLRSALGRVEAETIPRVVEALGQGDLFIGDVALAVHTASSRTAPPVAAAEARTPEGASRRGKTPGLVTRGSGAPTRGAKAGRKGGRHGAL